MGRNKRNAVIILILLLAIPVFAQEYQHFTVLDFSGGLNIKDAPTKLKSTEAVTLNNAMWKRGNSLAAKEGFRKFNSTAIGGDAVNSIYKWIKSEETKRWIVGSGDKLYVIDGDSTNFIGNELTYTTGTVNVDSLSKVVYGNGTKWKKTFGEGAGLSVVIGDSTYTIDQIVSNEILTITVGFYQDTVSNQSYTLYHKFSTDQKFFNSFMGKCIITDAFSPALSYDTSEVLPLAVRFFGDADKLGYKSDTLVIVDSSQTWVDNDLIGEKFMLVEYACTATVLEQDSIILYPISDQTKQWTREPTDSTCSYCLVDDDTGSVDITTYIWATITGKKERWKLDTLDTPITSDKRFYRADSLLFRVTDSIKVDGDGGVVDTGTITFVFAKYANNAGYLSTAIMEDSSSWGVDTSKVFKPSNTGGGLWSKSVVNKFYLDIRSSATADSVHVSSAYAVLFYTKRSTSSPQYPVLLDVVRNTDDSLLLEPSKLHYIDNTPQQYLVFNTTLLKRAFIDSGTTENMDSNTTYNYLYAYDTDKTWDSTDFQSGYYEIYFPRLGSYHRIIGNAYNVSGDDTGIVVLNLPVDWTSSERYEIYRWDYLKPTTQEIFDQRLCLAGDSLDPNYMVLSEKDAVAESERDFNTAFYNWVDRDDGDRIIRFKVFGENLYIFKQAKIKKMTKWIDYEITDLSEFHGTPSTHSIAEHPEGLYFFNRDGYYVLIEDKLYKTSHNIEPFIWDSVTISAYNKIVTAFFDDHLFVSLPTGSINDTTFVLYPPFASWGTLSGVITSCFFKNHDPADSNQLLFGDTDSGWVYVYGQSYQDLGSNYDITYKSGWFDMGTTLRKRVKDIKLNYEKADSTLIIFKFYTDYYDTLVYVDTVATDTLDVYHQVRLPLTPELMGYAFQLELNITRVDQEFVLPFFQLTYVTFDEQEYDE